MSGLCNNLLCARDLISSGLHIRRGVRRGLGGTGMRCTGTDLHGTGSGDIDARDGALTVRLDPLPTGRPTAAIAKFCEHLTATKPATSALTSSYATRSRPALATHGM